MDLSSAAGILSQVGFPGAVLALAVTVVDLGLLWAATGGRRGRPWSAVEPVGVGGVAAAVVAFAAGAAAFAPVIASVQIPVQVALNKWVMARLATADQRIWALPAVLVSGLIQEPAKLLAAGVGAAVLMLGGRRPAGAGARAVVLGVTAGAGFGALEAAFFLSAALGASAASGTTFPAAALAERLTAVLFHLSATGVVVYGWTRGVRAGLAALGWMSLAHGAINYVVGMLLAPLALSRGGVVIVETVAAVLALAVLCLLVYLVRPRPTEPAGAGQAEKGCVG